MVPLRSSIDLKIEVEVVLDQNCAYGSITCKTTKRSFPLGKATDVFMEDGSPAIVHNQILYLSSSAIDESILMRGWKEELFELTFKELDRLKILLEDDLHITGSNEKKVENILQLTDPYGTSANLLSGDESILLQHYQKKLIGQSHYYCPTDKVKKSLQGLKSAGFTIVDKQNRTLLLFSDKNLKWSIEKSALTLEGSLHFEGQTLPITEALQSKDRLFPLSPTTVALLPDKEELGLATGDPIEIHSDHISYPKTSVSLMYAQLKEYHTPLQEFPLIDPDPSFQGTLRPYQKIGLSWLYSLWKEGFSALLADDMGLGKTVQILALLSNLPPPHCIVVPKSLLGNWQREIERFLPGYEGITLTTYNAIREQVPTTYYETLILDEAQNIKNSGTKTSQSVRQIPSHFRLSLTGTPIENHLSDLISQFEFLLPGMLLPNEPGALFKKVRPFLLRRTKQDVLKELPERDDQIILVDMTEEQKAYYDAFLPRAKEMEILERILRLRQIACHPLLVTDEATTSGKMERVLEDLELCVEEGSKVLVFSQFTTLLTLLKRELKHPYLYLDGETIDRQSIVDQFQKGSTQILLSSLKVGGVGLNLTEADYVFILDPWWNEAVEEQAISRAHRMGRQGKVISRRYISRGTIEEKMLLLKDKKSDLAESLFLD